MVWLNLNAFGSKYLSHWRDCYCVHEVVLWTVFRLFASFYFCSTTVFLAYIQFMKHYYFVHF